MPTYTLNGRYSYFQDPTTKLFEDVPNGGLVRATRCPGNIAN
jgi:hypothetical protein